MILRSSNIKAALRAKQRGFILNPYRYATGGGGPVGTPYLDEVLADSPVKYLRFNDTSGSVAFSLTSAMGSGSLFNAFSLQQGALSAGGNSIGFDSTVDTQDGNGRCNLNFSTNYTTFTVEFLFSADASQPDPSPQIISKSGLNAASFNDFPFYISWSAGTGTLAVVTSTNNDYSADMVLSKAGLSANTTYHVVFVHRNNGLCELYINNVLEASTTISFAISTNTRNWMVGQAAAEIGGGIGTSGFKGKVAEVAIYSTALTSARIAAHYAALTVPSVETTKYDPATKAAGVTLGFSNRGLSYTSAAGGCRGISSKNTGKWYVEFLVGNVGSNVANQHHGIGTAAFNISTGITNSAAAGGNYLVVRGDGNVYTSGALVDGSNGNMVNNERYGIAVDCDAQTAIAYKNGVALHAAAAIGPGPYYPVSAYNTNASATVFMFPRPVSIPAGYSYWS